MVLVFQEKYDAVLYEESITQKTQKNVRTMKVI